ncbi:MAG: NADH-quinone oxidoreductase subunit H [Candidatus Diapherotrites archaeon]|nr:NADH-quinone oxidoreductase subunit H [Candidatus Diapherotrites archaeon]
MNEAMFLSVAVQEAVFLPMLVLKVFLAFLFGMLLVGFGRKMVAWGQSRRGPPVFQPALDVFKLFSKQTLFPKSANLVFFVLSPVAVFASALVLVIVLPVFAGDAVSSDLDLLVIVFLLLMVVMFDAVAGFAGKSIFGAIGASRELTAFIAYEVPFIVSIFSVVVKVGSFDLGAISAWQASNGPLAMFLPFSALVFFLVLIAKLRKSPFDVGEAHQEIIAGAKTEYSGILLAFFEMADWLMTFFMAGLFLVVFAGALSDVFLLASMFAVVALVCLLDLSFARLRIDQFFRVSWTVLLALSLIGLLTAVF